MKILFILALILVPHICLADDYDAIKTKLKIEELTSSVEQLTEENKKLKNDVQDVWHEMRALRRELLSEIRKSK